MCQQLVEYGLLVFWDAERYFGKAMSLQGELVFLHGRQFCLKNELTWISVVAPKEIEQGTRVVFVQADGPSGPRATRWALA